MSQGLTLEEMKIVGQVFQESIKFTLEGMTEDETKNVHTFMAELVMEKPNPALLLSVAGVAENQKKVFGNPALRDFFMKLSFVFFSRWSECDAAIMGLAMNLSRGLSHSPFGNNSVGDNTAIPDEHYKRLASRSDVQARLFSNQWLILLCMIPLFISKSSYNETV